MRSYSDQFRRSLLKLFCALGVGVSGFARSQEEESAASSPPAENDLLVFAFGDRAGEVMRPDDLATGSEQIFAYAMQQNPRVIRDGTRLYQIVLIRLDPDWLSDATRQRSVDGVVAYSGVCTHTGCDLTDWDSESRRFQCPCHESQFDPSDSARVVGGPAPLPLAALPLKLIDGQIAVARPFEGRVGFQQPGLSPFGI